MNRKNFSTLPTDLKHLFHQSSKLAFSCAMDVRSLVVFFPLTWLATVNGASAQPVGQYLSSVSGTINGEVIEFSASGLGNNVDVLSFSDADQGTNTARVVKDDDAAVGLASAHANFDVGANTGALHASVGGNILTKSANGAPYYISTGSLRASAIASWYDTAIAQSNSLAFGQEIRIIGVLELNGELGAENHRTRINKANASAGVKLTGTGIPVVSGFRREYTTPSSSINTPAPQFIPLNVVMKVGLPHEITYTLEVQVAGDASSDAAVSPGFADIAAYGYFANTLKWGGITSVTDVATGNVVSEWAITAASGFDYSQPYPVPEPATIPLLLFTAAMAAARFRQRKLGTARSSSNY